MLKRLAFLLIVCVAALPLIVPQSRAVAPEYDTAIINGRIVDGTGNPWFYGSVAIKDDRIVKVGMVDPRGAAKVIDAGGMIVAPGFIDVHTHVEGSLADNPNADNFINMGVTSLVTGNCGSSELQIGEFLSDLESRGISVNVATLIGHGSVRRDVMKEDNRAPTPDELNRMREKDERARCGAHCRAALHDDCFRQRSDSDG